MSTVQNYTVKVNGTVTGTFKRSDEAHQAFCDEFHRSIKFRCIELFENVLKEARGETSMISRQVLFVLGEPKTKPFYF